MTGVWRSSELCRLAAVLSGIALSACTHWKAEPLVPAGFQAADSNRTLRLTLRDGKSIRVRSPVIRGDTLIAEQELGDAFRVSYRPVRLPLDSISRAEKSRVSAGRTILLVSGLGLTALAIKAAADFRLNLNLPPCLVGCSKP